MSVISSGSPVSGKEVKPVNQSTKSVTQNARNWQKGIKTALALKISALVLAVLLTALTATAAILLFSASFVIGTAVVAGVLLLGGLAALIAQEVLLKKKNAEEEKALVEKNQLQEQLIQDLRGQLTNFQQVTTQIKNEMPELIQWMGSIENLKKLEPTTEVATKKEIIILKEDEDRIPTTFIETAAVK
jgi:uncharacterized coiled-coil protein SlyX